MTAVNTLADPELKTEWTDPVTGAKGYLVIDKLVDGMCGGGTRMRPGLTIDEVRRLARVMTEKLVGLDFRSGGAKAGIDFDPAHPDSAAVLRRFYQAHRPILLEAWSTGEDLGTREEDVIRALAELGISPIEAIIRKADDPDQLRQRVGQALRLTVEGMAITDVVTGFGVAAVTSEASELLGLPIAGARVAVQGFGSVGASSAKYLSRAGYRIVAVADSQGTIVSEDGLDIDRLLAATDRRGVIDRSRVNGFRELPREAWLDVDVDVLVPAAIADAITAENSGRVKARLIVEGANLPTTPEADAALRQRGVPVVPDFVANGGGAGLFGVVLYDDVEPVADAILNRLDERLRSLTRDLLRRAKDERHKTLREVGADLIDARVAASSDGRL